MVSAELFSELFSERFAGLGATGAVETMRQNNIDSDYQCTIGRSFRSPHLIFSFLNFLACVPLIAADIPAVLSLDKRSLGGLWTNSGYQRELESDCSDLLVLVGAATPELIHKRRQLTTLTPGQDTLKNRNSLTAKDIADSTSVDITLLGMGCLWAILEEAHITTLAIEPAWQGRKLGILLLCHLLQAAYYRGLARATLEVRASNQKALSLYRTFGFKEAGIRKRYYSDGENACILWCSGLQAQAMQTQIDQQKERAIAHLNSQHQQVFIRTGDRKAKQ